MHEFKNTYTDEQKQTMLNSWLSNNSDFDGFCQQVVEESNPERMVLGEQNDHIKNPTDWVSVLDGNSGLPGIDDDVNFISVLYHYADPRGIYKAFDSKLAGYAKLWDSNGKMDTSAFWVIVDDCFKEVSDLASKSAHLQMLSDIMDTYAFVDRTHAMWVVNVRDNGSTARTIDKSLIHLQSEISPLARPTLVVCTEFDRKRDPIGLRIERVFSDTHNREVVASTSTEGFSGEVVWSWLIENIYSAIL